MEQLCYSYICLIGYWAMIKGLELIHLTVIKVINVSFYSELSTVYAASSL